jgi:hypothetical protein
MLQRLGIAAVAVGILTGKSFSDEVEWRAASDGKIRSEKKLVNTKSEEPPLAIEVSPESKQPAGSDASRNDVPSPKTVTPEALGKPRTTPELLPLTPNSAQQGPDGVASDLLADPLENSPAPPARARFFASAEYLLWFTDRMSAPPLVTTAPLPGGGVIPPNFGLIGTPGTQILYGNGPIGTSFRMGGRFTLGFWLDCEQTCGMDAGFFFLGRNSQTAAFSSRVFPVLFRPFIQQNPPTGPNYQIVAFPPGFSQNNLPFPDQTGTVSVRTATGLWGAEINGRECFVAQSTPAGGFRIDLFAGFRYLGMDDRLMVVEDLVLGQNNIAGFPPNTAVIVTDRFDTYNQFYGGQGGVRWEARSGRLSFDGRASLALGGTRQITHIDGGQRVTPPAQPSQFFVGGLLALPSNIGRHVTGRFSFVPELTLNVGYFVRPGVKVFAGYNLLFWTNVQRAGEQIDFVLDMAQIPNFNDPMNPPTPQVPPRPFVLFRQSDFWAQGLQLGAELRW